MPTDKLTASHDLVAHLFSKKGIIKDKSAALIYLKKKMNEIGSGKKSELQFQDFLAIFLRGIAKAMVTGIFKEVT